MSNPNHNEARLLAGVALGGKSNSLQLFIQVYIVEAYLIILFSWFRRIWNLGSI